MAAVVVVAATAVVVAVVVVAATAAVVAVVVAATAAVVVAIHHCVDCSPLDKAVGMDWSYVPAAKLAAPLHSTQVERSLSRYGRYRSWSCGYPGHLPG